MLNNASVDYMNELLYPLFDVAQSSDSDNKSTSNAALNNSNRNLHTHPPPLFFLAHFFSFKIFLDKEFSIYMLSKLFFKFF